MESGQQSYSRKEKSLGLLVINFVNMCNRDDVDLIGLDYAASRLGVERRRIYDVVNILESIGIVARSGKNQYSWRGFGDVPRVLDELREEGMREKAAMIPYVANLEVEEERAAIVPYVTNSEMEQGMPEKSAIIPYVASSEMVLYDQVKEEPLMLTPDYQENIPSPKPDGKKEKCLWVLAQNFVKLFLCSGDELITLDGATHALVNESQDLMNMRTTVRRLYDIANVYSSMNLIEKTQIPGTKKPAYRWLGYETMSRTKFLDVPASLCDRNEPKKRAFGTEITNVSAKRNKTDGSEDRKPYGNQNTSIKIDQEQCDLKPDLKSLVSGPVTLAETPSKIKGRFGEIEELASTFRPQYCNPGLLGLFGHFRDTYKTWHEEYRKK
ncbi:hypothetical protein AALP_AA8G152700 [Arabis alpina]|uniref:E2F/DP family winged-helix DNA-binding domain-containing protein n=1 Tax=Arabis alpina TaxID=50452 RepID=A0A087G782_ARAAL|nr:hypothetical protein AALP_AA8G152700 [Arabis alpina]